nr:DUF2971 domain-containing protein [Pseudogemmobacter hezensis]
MVLRETVALGACFSEAGDQLSQWRGYAADGAGFAIAFDRSELEAAIPKEGEQAPELTNVIYGREAHDRRDDLFRSLHEPFFADFLDYSVFGGFGSMSIDNTKSARDAKLCAVRKLFAFKNPAFVEEKEWRLLLVGYLSQLEKMDFREAGGVISPLVKMPFPAAAKRSVRLGPTNKTPERVIKALLAREGIKADVRKSSASYTSR